MKNRLIQALKNDQIINFINNQYLFGIFLKGGYEDLFSKQLYNLGFENNLDLIPQYQLNDGNRIDIAQIAGNNIVSLVEFGHQFSLQFNNNSALNKIREDARKRIQPITMNGNMYNVQIITDIIEINFDEVCIDYFTNRYGINNSIQNRQMAIDRINGIKDTVDQFNYQHNIENGQIVNLDIENDAGKISLNFLVNGPYNYEFRLNQ
jgi:hypothetical protein